MSPTYEEVKRIVDRYGTEREQLLPILQAASEKFHFLSEPVLSDVASAMKLSSATVFGVASFYSFLDSTNRGENIIRICNTISCDLKGKAEIISALEKRLNISIGETTPDGRFSLLGTACIGWCHESPAMLINDKVYTALTPESALSALENWL